MLSDPKGCDCMLGWRWNQPSPAAGTMVFAIDGTTGVLTQTGNAGGGSENGRAIAMDARGRFFFDSWGLLGRISGERSHFSGGRNRRRDADDQSWSKCFPSSLLTESSGRFLYAQTSNGLLIYSIDQTSGALTLVNGPLAHSAFSKRRQRRSDGTVHLFARPAGVDVFQVDPQTGNLAEIRERRSASGRVQRRAVWDWRFPAHRHKRFRSGGGAVSIVHESGRGQRGQTTSTKIVSLVNTGNQILAVNGISVTGANAGGFCEKQYVRSDAGGECQLFDQCVVHSIASGSGASTVQVTTMRRAARIPR